MLVVITPLESAEGARKQLAAALQKLAEAQVEVSQAMSTLAMFETSFRQGAYVQAPPPTYTTTTIVKGGVTDMDTTKNYDWPEVTGRDD